MPISLTPASLSLNPSPPGPYPDPFVPLISPASSSNPLFSILELMIEDEQMTQGNIETCIEKIGSSLQAQMNLQIEKEKRQADLNAYLLAGEQWGWISTGLSAISSATLFLKAQEALAAHSPWWKIALLTLGGVAPILDALAKKTGIWKQVSSALVSGNEEQQRTLEKTLSSGTTLLVTVLVAHGLWSPGQLTHFTDAAKRLLTGSLAPLQNATIKLLSLPWERALLISKGVSQATTAYYAYQVDNTKIELEHLDNKYTMDQYDSETRNAAMDKEMKYLERLLDMLKGMARNQ